MPVIDNVASMSAGEHEATRGSTCTTSTGSRLLREQKREVPVVVGGSVITPEDARAIRAKGVAAAFGPTAGMEEIVATVERLARPGASAGS